MKFIEIMKLSGLLWILVAVSMSDPVAGYGFGAPGCVPSPSHFADPMSTPSPYNITIM
jgi:hypothetical protein